jgi:uncharacterized protein (TIGR00369 family)
MRPQRQRPPETRYVSALLRPAKIETMAFVSLHGGALAAFADDLGGALAGLNVPPGFRTTTIESKTNIFRACVPGRLTGVAVPVHVGRRTIVLQTSIYRADGKLAAMMIQTQMVLRRGSAIREGEDGGEA